MGGCVVVEVVRKPPLRHTALFAGFSANRVAQWLQRKWRRQRRRSVEFSQQSRDAVALCFGDAEVNEGVAAKDGEGREVVEIERADERFVVFDVEVSE